MWFIVENSTHGVLILSAPLLFLPKYLFRYLLATNLLSFTLLIDYRFFMDVFMIGIKVTNYTYFYLLLITFYFNELSKQLPYYRFYSSLCF